MTRYDFFFLSFLFFFSAVSATALPPAFAAPTQETLWVFAVGVSQYKNSSIDLQYADYDAQSLAKAFQAQSGKVFRQVKTKVLINQEVTRHSLLQAMRTFFAQIAPNDTALIALMGHGVEEDSTYYFVPHPADLTNLTTEGLRLDAFEEAVRGVGMKVKRLILAVDTCHAGAIAIRTRSLRKKNTGIPKSRGISLDQGFTATMGEVYVLSSSRAEEESVEDLNYRLPGEEKGHGAFTYALLRGLRGEADLDQDQVINIFDLFRYTSDQVPKITGGSQKPHFQVRGTDFALAEVPPRPNQEAAQEAKELVKKATQEREQGHLARADETLAKAEQLNPRDELTQLLREQVHDDLTYPGSKKEADIVDQANKILKGAREQKPFDPWAPRPMIVAFLDFETLQSGAQYAGLHEVLAHRIAQALAGTKRVQLVERRLLEKILEELKLSMSNLSNPATQLQVGKILSARLMATGKLIVNAPRFDLTLRMFDTETSTIKINLSKDSTDPEKILAMTDEIASLLVQQLQREYPIRGKIIAVDEGELILNIGAKHGVTLGATFKALIEKPVTVSGQVVAHRTRAIGKIDVTAVDESASFARIMEQQQTFGEGTKVIEQIQRP